jgi:hypothetical protein
MTREEAKRILWLYREGTDANDPAFAEALQEADRDPQLALWLKDHLAAYASIRAQLQAAPVPPGLTQKILASQQLIPWWRSPAYQLAASLFILAVLGIFWFSRPAKEATLDEYRRFTARVVTGKYAMGLESADQAVVRRFLVANQAPSDFELPTNLAKERLLGCAALSWDGHPISLLCFRRQPGPGAPDLWFFITDGSTLPKPIEAPQFANVTQIGTVGWSSAGKTYLLASREDAPALQRYVEKVD